MLTTSIEFTVTITYRFPSTVNGRLHPALESAYRLADLSEVPCHIYKRDLPRLGSRYRATMDQPTYEQAVEFFPADADGSTTCSHRDLEGDAIDAADFRREGIAAAV